MALLRWGTDDDDNKDDDNLFASTPVQSVVDTWDGPSAQSSTQPSSSTQSDDSDNAVSNNYLMSAEKAQHDQQQAQARAQAAAAAAARAQAAAQAAAQARQQAIAQAQARQQPQQQMQVAQQQAQSDDGWKKYYDASFQKEKQGMGFWDRIFDNGAASRLAEQDARNRYAAELNRRAFRNGVPQGQDEVNKARAVSAYNMQVAKDYGNRAAAASRAVGATSDSNNSFLGKMVSTSNAIKDANFYNAIGGVDDRQNAGANDVGRFITGLLQGMFTAPITGTQQLAEAATGTGTSAQTGAQERLNGGERAGRTLEGLLNVVSPFFGGSGRFLDEVSTPNVLKALSAKVASGTASNAEKRALKEGIEQLGQQWIRRDLVHPAIEQAGIGATQAGANYFGEGGGIRDENGNLDMSKLENLTKQVGIGGAQGAAGGLILSGAAKGLNALRNRNLVEPEDAAGLRTRTTLAQEEALPPGEILDATEPQPAQVPEQPSITPEAETPVNVPESTNTNRPGEPVKVPEAETPVNVPESTNTNRPGEPVKVPEVNLGRPPKSSIVSQEELNQQVAPLAEPTQQAEPTPAPKVAETSKQPTELDNTVKELQEQPTIQDTQPVKTAPDNSVISEPADTAIEATKNTVNNAEKIKALQDAKVGSTQAEEAEINKQLKQVKNSVPKIEGDDALKQEALKYKTPEEFVRAKEDAFREFYKQRQLRVDEAFDKLPKEPKYSRSDMTRRSAEIYATKSKKDLASIVEDSDASLANLKAAILREQKGSLRGSGGSELLGSYMTAERSGVVPDNLKRYRVLEGERFRPPDDLTPDEVSKFLPDNPNFADLFKVMNGKLYTDNPSGPSPKQLTDLYNQAHTEAKTPEPNLFKVTPTKSNKIPTEPQSTQVGTPAKVVDQSNSPTEMQPAKTHPSNLPPGMEPTGKVTPVKIPAGGKTPTVKKGKISPQDKMINRVISTLDKPTEYIKQVAQAISPDDGQQIKAENMRDTLDMYGDKGNSGLKSRIADKYEKLEKMVNKYNKTQFTNRRNLKESGMKGAEVDITQGRSELQRQMGVLQKDLAGDIRKLAAQTSGKARAKMIYDNLNHYRKSNMLFGAPNVERQITQDILGLVNDVVKNPRLMGKSLLRFPAEYKRSVAQAARDWKTPPKTVSEMPKYVLGNLYESAMALGGVEGAVRARTSGYRDVIARNALSKLGWDVTPENISKMSKMMGNEAEVMAHTAAGVANFMTSNTQFKKASDAYNAYLDGDASAQRTFLDNVARQSTVTEQIKEQLIKGKSPFGKVAAYGLDFVSPFVRTATNAIDTAATGTFNPLSKSAADYILSSGRSKGGNALAIAKNKLLDGAMITGVAGLAMSGGIVYNDGDEVDKPRGLSIKGPNGVYIPIRATNIELPIAITYAAVQLTKDINNGTPINASKYIQMIDGSLPYVDSIANVNGALGSLFAGSGDTKSDNKYKATAYGVNALKSYTPLSNNAVRPAWAGLQGNSINAKSTYDKSPTQWYKNQLINAYPGLDNSKLPDSRDSAGRVRTMDNQGVLIHKNINDADTAKYNSTIDNLVTYGRNNGIGNNVDDMFSTFDNGKNNSFKTIESTIWAVTGKGGKDTLLKSDPKLADLSKQVYDGFYGDGSPLLTLDGKNLYSDVSMPNSTGSKNSSKPISMLSIKNAIAATDLSKEDVDKMRNISDQVNTMYNTKVKSGQMTYDQYQANRAELEKGYGAILGKSKNYQKMQSLMSTLKSNGFFDKGGFGSTRSGQNYLWKAMNAMLGDKGKTPAADFPEPVKSYGGYGRSGGGGRKRGIKASDKTQLDVPSGYVTPVKARSMAKVKLPTNYTPAKVSIKLNNKIKKDKTQNYANITI